MLRSDVARESVGDSGSRDDDTAAVREVTNLVARRRLWRDERRDDDDLGRDSTRSVRDRLDRRVGAEEGDAPTAVAQRERENDEAEVVLVARGCCEERVPAAPTTPAPAEPEQASAEEVAREVLLRHRDLAALPALTEVAEDGQDDLAE